MQQQPNGSTDWTALAREVGTGLRDGVVAQDQSGGISRDVVREAQGSGITSALVPVESGGGGASHAEMGQILRELGRHDPATAVALSMHSHLLAAQVWRHRHGIDAEKVFRRVVDDRAILVSTGTSDWVGSTAPSARSMAATERAPARGRPAAARSATSW